MLVFSVVRYVLNEVGRSPLVSGCVAVYVYNGAKSGFEMCFGPSTLGAGAKTRLESRIKKFTPHYVPFISALVKMSQLVAVQFMSHFD